MGYVPKSIVGGIEENNEVYICRCWTGGQLVPGKFLPWRGNCVVEWQGTVDCTAGQVLVYEECEGLNCPNDLPAKCEHNCPNEWTAELVLLLNKASPTGEKEDWIWAFISKCRYFFVAVSGPSPNKLQTHVQAFQTELAKWLNMQPFTMIYDTTEHIPTLNDSAALYIFIWLLPTFMSWAPLLA